MILKALFPIDDMGKIEKLLIKIKNLKNHAEKEKHGLSIQVVFMAEPVTLLTADNHGHKELHQQLESQGVHITVCKNAMAAFGIAEEDLIPAAIAVTSGVGEVIYKQMEGWGVYWC